MDFPKKMNAESLATLCRRLKVSLVKDDLSLLVRHPLEQIHHGRTNLVDGRSLFLLLRSASLFMTVPPFKPNTFLSSKKRFTLKA